MSTYDGYRADYRYAKNKRFWIRVATLMLTGVAESPACEIARKHAWRCDCGKPPNGILVMRPLVQSMLMCDKCAAEMNGDYRRFGEPPEAHAGRVALHKKSIVSDILAEVDVLTDIVIRLSAEVAELRRFVLPQKIDKLDL